MKSILRKTWWKATNQSIHLGHDRIIMKNRRLQIWLSSSSGNLLGSKIFQYFLKFWPQRFSAVLLLIDSFTYCDTDLILWNGTEIRIETAWRDPSSTARQLQYEPAVRGYGHQLLQRKDIVTEIKECNIFVFIMCFAHIWYVFNPYISDFTKKIHWEKAVVVFYFYQWPSFCLFFILLSDP